MPYKIYLNKNGTTVIKWRAKYWFSLRCTNRLLLVLLCLVLAGYGFQFYAPNVSARIDQSSDLHLQPQSSAPVVLPTIETKPNSMLSLERVVPVYSPQLLDNSPFLPESLLSRQVLPSDSSYISISPERWTEIKIKKGDSFGLIFNRLGLTNKAFSKLLALDEIADISKRVKPGEIVRVQMDDNELEAMEYQLSPVKLLLVKRVAGQYQAEIVDEPLETQLMYAQVQIQHSLFLDGQKAGLSDKLIMELADIYAWDIDFALDLRAGDEFAVLYQAQYSRGKLIHAGPILAAKFINQGKTLKAVRYKVDSNTDYYSDNGTLMRKTFLRAPVNFTKISSKFSLVRSHPVLNTIRAHRGVDYAAPVGTPVRSTGNGIIEFAGRKDGYGKTIIVKHQNKYSTLYAHLSRYKEGLRKGQQVQQNQVIGYVGKTGLATGPHLHYEFRINNKHYDPLKVVLPKTETISVEEQQVFNRKVAPVFHLLDRLAKTPVQTPMTVSLEDSNGMSFDSVITGG